MPGVGVPVGQGTMSWRSGRPAAVSLEMTSWLSTRSVTCNGTTEVVTRTQAPTREPRLVLTPTMVEPGVVEPGVVEPEAVEPVAVAGTEPTGHGARKPGKVWINGDDRSMPSNLRSVFSSAVPEPVT